MALRKELWQRGLRFRKNVATLPGKPDIVFGPAKVAVFCDGDFWHGRNWETLRKHLACRANPDYWIAKIGSNIQRDQRVSRELEAAGWHVARLWETDIRRDVGAAGSQVEAIVRARRQSRPTSEA